MTHYHGYASPDTKPQHQDSWLRDTVAGIVTYRADLALLQANLNALVGQVAHVIVYDNGSTNAAYIKQMLQDTHRDATFIGGDSNHGVATALNRIAQSATSRGFRWLLTLDQDSAAGADMVRLLHSALDEKTPMVTPFIIDRKKMTPQDLAGSSLPPIQIYRHAACKGAITSGALVDLHILNGVGGFDDSLFIDYVDYDLNMRLMRAGYKIARVNGTYLLHQVGDAKRTWMVTPRKSIDGRWRLERFYSFGHSEGRCYYKARNRVIYSRKHWRSIGLVNEGIAQIPQQIVLTMLFESARVAKLRAFLRGIKDGISAPIGGDVSAPVQRRTADPQQLARHVR